MRQLTDLLGRAPTVQDAEALAATLSPEEYQALLRESLTFLADDQRANQLLYYEVANPAVTAVHASTAREIGIVGGKRSSKTDTALAELAIQMTGLVPKSLEGLYPKAKLRPPIRARLVVTSIQNAWDIHIKQKLQWFQWSGPGMPEEGRGHWGWIPRDLLPAGKWERGWSEKHRTLTLINGSILHVMAHEQALEDFAQGNYHLIIEDELPPEVIHRENRNRVMDLRGQILVAGTPPDDRSAAVTAAWFHDQLYEPGLRGDDPDVLALAIWTEHNRILRKEDIRWLADGLTEEQQAVRLHGAFLHLAGLIFPEFTSKPQTWCFRCETRILADGERCPGCEGDDLVSYCHVLEDDEPFPRDWPTLVYLDPHPRRPTAVAWFRVDPVDNWWMDREVEIGGDAEQVRDTIRDIEREEHWTPLWTKADPKITIQENQFAGQEWTIGMAMQEVGFSFLPANPTFSTAMDRIRRALRPDPRTRQPRLRFRSRCRRAIYQMGHYVWDEFARRVDRDVKEKPKDRDSDFPALVRYLANDDPTWLGCQHLQYGRPWRRNGIGRSQRTGY